MVDPVMPLASLWAAEPRALPRPRRTLAERLQRTPLLLDGAMGTLLYARGVPQRANLEELVELRPELIGAVHREAIAAGADIIETDTFGANRLRLAPYGLAERAGRLNRRAAQLAREAREVAGGRDVLVAGSIGPLASPIRAPGRIAEADARDAVEQQVDGLLEGGVDLLIAETASTIEELLLIIATIRARTDLPLLASMTFGEELIAVDGTTPETAARLLMDADVDGFGVNCGGGPVACLDALARMSTEGPAPLMVMPNAGLPTRIEGRFVYAADPAYFAAEVPRFLDAGARLIGGCCGTTPEHIAAMRGALDALTAAPSDAATTDRSARPSVVTLGSVTAPGTSTADADPVGPAAPPPTGLARALAEGRFVISVEIDPPRSVRLERTLEAARILQAAGVDTVNISDSAMARVRMGAMAVAFGIQHDLDLECVVHVTTRDRNLMALESELLGAHALGVRDILALTGDPPRIGDFPTGTGVWDTDSTGLIAILRRLNRGEDQAGKPIGAPAGFTIACALDPTAADLDREIERLAGKLDAGADLVMTQPIYDPEQWQRFMDRAAARFGDTLPKPVLLGVLPLHSSRHAEFLHHEVPGITIPDSVRAAMAAAGERGSEVGGELALELVERMRSLVAGTYLMPSFGRYEHAAEVVRQLRANEPVTPRDTAGTSRH
jgi:homocysteine S-methyltransferase